jgi:bidirectional [NiFe] hydrogenase diaphorase subunit
LRAARLAHAAVTSADEAAVAAACGLPVAAVHGAASYYADFGGARGARHVRVCAGTACFVASGGGGRRADVERALGVAMGGCAADGGISLQPVHCLGYCDAGPAALDGDAPRAGPDLAEVARSGLRGRGSAGFQCDPPLGDPGEHGQRHDGQWLPEHRLGAIPAR